MAPSAVRHDGATPSQSLPSGAQTRKENFGLGNPRRVQKIPDLGDSFYRADHHPSPRAIKAPTKPVDVDAVIDQIQKAFDLCENTETCFLDCNNIFIPRARFDLIITPDRVAQLVWGLECFRGVEDKCKLAHQIYNGEGQHAPCLKVLGVLIAIDRQEEMMNYIKEGLRDDCLPLRFDYNRGPSVARKRLICRHANHDHTILNSYSRDLHREDFVKWARRLTAPYIKWQSHVHSHYIIEKGDCLPMYADERKQQASEEVRGSGIGGQATGQPEGFSYGGFSEVHKVKICDSHSAFGSQRLQNPHGYYALKKLTSPNRETFNLELSSLLFCADQDGSKRHLIQLLATFEEYNPVNKTSAFFLLFDWAYGDLVEFWRSNPQLVLDKNHCLWMAEQFHGLSEALQVVHNDRIENLKHLPKAISDQDLYGRHGDIKASNLLWFESSGLGSLRSELALADFGLGRLHTKVSRSKQDPNLLQRTATYRAPEFDLPEGLVSPVSDIFSLGCVFLEHISWYLLGFNAVMNEFPELREELDIHGFGADTFFSVRNASSQRPEPLLKLSVKNWIQRLRDHAECTWYLRQMLDLIEFKMLEPRREDRIRALPLTKELRTLMVSCQRTPSFYLDRSNSSG